MIVINFETAVSGIKLGRMAMNVKIWYTSPALAA